MEQNEQTKEPTDQEHSSPAASVELAKASPDQEAYYAQIYKSTFDVDLKTVVGGPGRLHSQPD